MSKQITPFLWFDTCAEEAITFYTSIFDNSHIVSIKRYPGGPLEGPMQGMEGRVLTAEFELAGERFFALDGGPMFKFTPAISFFVNCETEAEIDAIWGKLSDGASVLMPLQAHPFSPKFGWLADKYGLSWQLNIGARPQKITPFLMFTGQQHGKAAAALNFYTGLFRDAAIHHVEHYGASENGAAGTVKHALFQLGGREFMAIDSGLDHAFGFSGATSFYVDCETQEEVDRLWNALSAVPQAEQCGWLMDEYGISWQIIPTALPRLMSDPDPEKAGRVMQAMLQMKKIDIAGLQRAYDGL